jgi:hypothetical protein
MNEARLNEPQGTNRVLRAAVRYALPVAKLGVRRVLQPKNPFQ